MKYEKFIQRPKLVCQLFKHFGKVDFHDRYSQVELHMEKVGKQKSGQFVCSLVNWESYLRIVFLGTDIICQNVLSWLIYSTLI